jgi:hypothetical protein
MKKIIKSSILIALLFIAACSDNNNVVDDVFANTTSGGVLRNVNLNNIIFDNDNISTTAFDIDVEVQDSRFGDLTEKIEVMVSFEDKNDTGNSKPEALAKTILASQFGPRTERNLPLVKILIPLTLAKTTLNLTDAQVKTCDQFKIRLIQVMKDGRRFSNNNANATITGGGYFKSPFIYAVDVVGGPLPDNLAGTHTFQSFNMRRGPSAAGVACGGVINGTVTWTDTDVPGVYATSDLSFGQFGACWGDSPATSASAKIKWFCKEITSIGKDQYGDSYTYTMVSVSGNQMTIDWINTYNDRGRTIITRQGGANWPAILQNP